MRLHFEALKANYAMQAEGGPQLVFCGDTFLRTHNGVDPFSLILSDFRNAHVCMNLETSLKGGVKKKKPILLSIKEEMLDHLPEQVLFINIANNHVGDEGEPRKLMEALQKRKKVPLGPENPSLTCASVEGIEVDFFSAYFRLPRLRLSYNGCVAEKLEKMIRTSKATRRVVNLHWGYEHTDVPSPYQRDLAHRLVDAGASLIIGHHPHVPQGQEVYHGAPIFYSLGNFNFWQFDTETTEKNRWGYMIRFDIKNKTAEPIFYRINENYQPISITENENDKLMTRFEELNEKIASTDSKIWFNTYYKQWLIHEFNVWKNLCLERKKFSLMPKWFVWLLLPMQLKFYTIMALSGRQSKVD